MHLHSHRATATVVLQAANGRTVDFPVARRRTDYLTGTLALRSLLIERHDPQNGAGWRVLHVR